MSDAREWAAPNLNTFDDGYGSVGVWKVHLRVRSLGGLVSHGPGCSGAHVQLRAALHAYYRYFSIEFRKTITFHYN